ncbi:MAG: DUF2807 domain-containing protein [Crocinitomicaceae bacterium]|jgi:hypothetical protein|nr:DUF2807 domain-containing protein [Crocinitomicaceae bacterium]
MNRLILLLVLFAFGCKKSEDRSCWKFNGQTAEKKMELADFQSMEIGPYMKVHLVQDSSLFVVLTGGENVINLVSTAVLDGKLTILNENKCKFLRNLNKVINVEVHFKQLKEILYKGSHDLTNEGNIVSPNLSVTLKESSGSVNLKVNCGNLEVSAEPSWADYKIQGICDQARFTVKGNSFGDTRGLKVNNLLTVLSRSSGDLKIDADATGVLKCETWGKGNVYYYGTPSSIEWNNYGTGKLLQGN